MAKVFAKVGSSPAVTKNVAARAGAATDKVRITAINTADPNSLFNMFVPFHFLSLCR